MLLLKTLNIICIYDKTKNETISRKVFLHLLLVLTPPNTRFGDCLLPSANEVVLGRPLISSSASSTPKVAVSFGRLSLLLLDACVLAVFY